MNRSSYLTRKIDETDHTILAALFADGRITTARVAKMMRMSSPSVAARILKLKDAGAIKGYTVVIDPKVFGFGIAAHVRMNAKLGEAKRLEQMLGDSPEIVEADHITGGDCFMTKVVVRDAEELKAVLDRFSTFAATESAIIMSSTVPRRLPKM